MTDFVTQLESELRKAALRRERAGVVRGVAVPRVRLALGDLPTAALATVLLGLALAGATILLASSAKHAAQGQLPQALRGTWHTWRVGPTELRLYQNGATRCTNLGLESSQPCYTIGRPYGVAEEWGELSVGRGELTLQAALGGPPGTYRWRVKGRALRLAEVRDAMTSRAEALTSQPLVRPRRHNATARIPLGWSARSFTSEQHGYSIRYPSDWSARGARAPGQADRLSPSAGPHPLDVTIGAVNLPRGTSAGRWSVIVNSRPEGAGGCIPGWYSRRSVDGEPAMVTQYPDCHGADELWASFAHGRRGYIAVWRGKMGRSKDDGPRFAAMLRTVRFSR